MIGDPFRRPLRLPSLAPDGKAGAPRPGGFPFQAHVELLQLFVAHRSIIVDAIQQVLNGQRKPDEYLQDRALLWRLLEDCFFTLPAINHNQHRLRGHLEAAHWADGFKPRDLPGLHNSLIDPAELMIRGFHLWRQTQWPGRNGRLRYAHTLFHLYVVRCLALLTMRLWDEGSGGAGDRLSQVQGVLDELWADRPADHPVLVRDARWLLQLAQSPATDDLGAYFHVARNVAETLPLEDRLEIHRAGVRMAGGHLRSQLHYYATKNAVPLDDQRLVSNTRTTNALDVALLIQELVPLLTAYEHACRGGDRIRRRELADAILQGISPDPELFLTRVELLGPYSMIEHLFVGTEGDRVAYTPMGERHAELIREYQGRIDRVSTLLYDDSPGFRPIPGSYSPYGILYGFSSDLIEHMALKTIQRDAAQPFSMEDVFVSGGAGTEKLAWVSGWRKLPHVPPDVQKLFEYPQTFAEGIFHRVEAALRRRALGDTTGDVVSAGRLFIVGEDGQARTESSSAPDLPVQYIASSDVQVVAAGRARPQDESQLLADRREGRCVLSYRTEGGWVAISKAILTEVLGTGRDAKITGLPPQAARTFTLMCRDLVVLPPDSPVTSNHYR